MQNGKNSRVYSVDIQPKWRTDKVLVADVDLDILLTF